MSGKVAVFSCREFDEGKWFTEYAQELGLTLSKCPTAPTMETIARTVEGCSCATIVTTPVDRQLMREFASCGVKYISTRTIGYDHIDLAAAKEFGISIGNAPYGPNGVADYTLMLTLMSIRKMKPIIERTNIQDYTLFGLQGRELKDLTVGVVGTGRIGRTVVGYMKGLAKEVLCYDICPNPTVAELASYVALEEIWQKCDVITFHAPLTADNFHMVNADTIAQMKDGVVLINTARGGLIDSKALIDGIESGKIGAAGLDVVENEFNMYYYDRKSDVMNNHELAILRGFPNVTISHHMAFYTDNAIKTMVGDSLRSCRCVIDGQKNPWEIRL